MSTPERPQELMHILAILAAELCLMTSLRIRIS